MTGQAHWLTLALIIGGGVIVWLAVYLEGWSVRPKRGQYFRRLNVVCPHTAEQFDCTVSEEKDSKTVVQVERCPAFRDPEAVTCDQGCAKKLNEARQGE